MGVATDVMAGTELIFGLDFDSPEKLLVSIVQSKAESDTGKIVSMMWSPQNTIFVGDQPMNYGPSAIALDDTFYCFFQSGTSGNLWCSSYTAGTSSPDLQLPANVSAPGTPGAVVFQDDLYVFYEGPGNNGQLWYSVFDGTGWTSAVVPNVSMSQTPAATVFNDNLYVFYQSAAANGTICYSVFDGTIWAAEVQPPIGGISESPSVVSFTPPGAASPQLYVFYQGGGNTGGLFYNAFDGTTWTKNTQVSNVTMSCSPSAAVFDNQIYVVHQGGGNNGQLWYNAFNGTTWAGDTQVVGVLFEGSPSVMLWNNVLYIAYLWMGGLLFCSPLFTAASSGSAPVSQTVAGCSAVAYTAPGATSAVPFVFYLTSGTDGLLGYSQFFGPNDWGAPTQLPNLGVSGSPSAVLFNNQPYVFYEGAGKLWYSEFNGTLWSSIAVPNINLSQSPSAVVFNSQIYVFYEDSQNNGQLWYTTFNGSAWSAGVQLTGVSLSECPSAAVFNNELYVFYQGAGSDGQLWYNVLSGSTWAGPTQVAGASMSGSPSAVVVFNNTIGANQLGVFYQGPANNGALCYSVFSAGSWSAQTAIADVEISASPLAVVFNNLLYCFFEGAGDNTGQLWYSIFSGTTWSQEAPVVNISMSGQPSAIVYAPPNEDSQLYIFHTEASQSDQIWYCVCASGTWTSGEVSSPGLSCGPSATVFNNQPWVFYQGPPSQAGQLYFSFLTGDTWNSAQGPVTISESPSAVTFTAPGASTAQIYVFYQDVQANGELWFASYDGNGWSSNTQVSGVNISDSPSAVVFTPPNGSADIYVFYNDPSNNGQLNYTIFNGSSWTAAQTVPGVSISSSPSAMVIGGVLYVAYKGSGDFFYVSFDGTSWSQATQIGALFLSNSPSVLTFDDKLYCFMQGLGTSTLPPGLSQNGNGELWFAASNGNYWSWNTLVDNVTISGSPSSTVFDSQAFVFYQGGGTNGQLWYSAYDSDWVAQAQLIPEGQSASAAIMSCSPSTTVFTPSGASAAELYVFYQGPGNNGMLWYSVSSDSSSWGAQVQLVPAGIAATSALMSESPAAAVFDEQLYVFYQGSGNNGQLMYTVSTDGASWGAQATVPGISDYSPGCSPFAVVFNNQLYVFYSIGGTSSDQSATLCYSVFDGSSWSESIRVSASNPVNDIFANMYQSASAAVLNDRLYVLFQNVQVNGELWYTTFDGSNWSTIVMAGLINVVVAPTGAAVDEFVTTSESAFLAFKPFS